MNKSVEQKNNSLKLIELSKKDLNEILGGGVWERVVEKFRFNYLNYGIVIKNSNSR